MEISFGRALWRNFLGQSPDWYKLILLVFLVVNPLLFYVNPFVAGWLLVAEFIFTLAMALKCYPLLPGGLLAFEAVVIGMTSAEHVKAELASNLEVLLLLMFMVAGIYFMKQLLLFIFTRLLLGIRSKMLLSLAFCVASAFLSAFLDALTVVAVVISVAVGFYGIYHKAASARPDDDNMLDDSHIEPIVKKFRAEGVDGIMLCHANFGTEYVCARLARELGLPVLLWGPRDERPEPDGTRLRDSQCGLFATGKVLRRFQVPFTYMTNCRLTDPEFERGVWDFLAVCNVVKTFKHTRILQMATRPFDFWSTMCNEGELLEKFNIQLSPIPMTELVQAVRDAQADEQAMAAMLAHIADSFEICIPEDKVPAVEIGRAHV